MMDKKKSADTRPSRVKRTNKYLNLIEDYFQSIELRYGKEKTKDGGFMLMGVMGGYKGIFTTFTFIIRIGDDAVRGYALLPFSISEDRRQVVAELITRINYRLKFGKFIMDFNDGEVRFQVAFPPEVLEHAPKRIAEQLLYLPLGMIRDWVDAFDEVARRFKTPKGIVNQTLRKIGMRVGT